MARYAMVTDVDTCVGCQACTVACNAEWDVPDGYARTHVHATPSPARSPPDLRLLRGAVQPLRPPAVRGGVPDRRDVPGATTASCKVDHELCIGCGYCVEACPYDARYLNPVTSKVDKCDFCRPRSSAASEPACVATCTAHAKYFGDLEDRQSDVFRLVYARGRAADGEPARWPWGPTSTTPGSPRTLDLVAGSVPAAPAAPARAPAKRG